MVTDLIVIGISAPDTDSLRTLSVRMMHFSPSAAADSDENLE